MGFLRTMFGSGLAKDDPRTYLVEAMVAAIDADGDVSDAELKKLHEKLDTMEIFKVLSQDSKDRLVDQAAESIEAAGGGRARVAEIAKGLPSRAERVMAYTLAAELCVADNEVQEREIPYLESLQDALGLPEEEAREIFEAVRTKSSVSTIEERVSKMHALMPRFIDSMVLLTLADGKVDDREVDGIATVLEHIADARSFSENSLHDEVAAAFTRLSGRPTNEAIDEIAKAIQAPQDRFWTMTYMMIVAATDGAKDWQELGLLAQFQKAFGLDSKAMDGAMKIALQFPNVKITGRAPVSV
jgi:uncharacterized membrane protein YebE (DUF533 family)